MDLNFEIGSAESPKGHSFVYFTDMNNQSIIFVTYIVVLPISADIGKYVPPFLMNQFSQLDSNDFSAFAFPPIPEQFSSLEKLKKLASLRSDDLIYGGLNNSSDSTSMLNIVQSITEKYSKSCTSLSSINEISSTNFSEHELPTINDVMYEMMNEKDKLNELSQLVSKLRFACETSNQDSIAESEQDILLLSRYLPDRYDLNRVVEVLKQNDAKSAKLADLYIQRCFHLAQEEYSEVAKLENIIKDLE